MNVRLTTFVTIALAAIALLAGVGVVATSVGVPAASTRSASIQTNRPLGSASTTGSAEPTSLPSSAGAGKTSKPAAAAKPTAPASGNDGDPGSSTSGASGNDSAGSSSSGRGTSGSSKGSGGSGGASTAKPDSDDDEHEREVVVPPVREDDMDDEDDEDKSSDGKVGSSAPHINRLLNDHGDAASEKSPADDETPGSSDSAPQVGNVSSD